MAFPYSLPAYSQEELDALEALPSLPNSPTAPAPTEAAIPPPPPAPKPIELPPAIREIAAKYATQAPAPSAPKPPASKPAEAYLPQSIAPSDYPKGLSDADIIKAQEYKDFMSQMAMFGKAGSQIGAGFASVGTKQDIKPGEGIWAELEKQGAAPSANIKERRAAADEFSKREKTILDLNSEKSGQDPNSPESKVFRAMLKQKYPSIMVPENLPLTKLKDMGFKVDGSDTKRFQQTVIEDGGQMKIARFDTQSGNVELVNTKGLSGPALKGYAPSTDPTTGEKSTANQALGRQTLVPTEEQAKELSPQDYPLNEKVRKEISKRQLDIYNVPGVKESQILLQEVGTAMTLADQAEKNPMAYNMLGTVVARAFQGGRLTDKDVVLYTGRKDWAGRLSQAIQDASSGTFNPQSSDLLKAALKIVASKETANLDRAYQQEAEKVSKNNKVPVEAVLNRLKPGMTSSAPKDSKIEQWAKQYGKTYEQAEQILRNRGYGK